MGAFIDLKNRVFDRLTVIGEIGKTKDGAIRWLCKCECGVEKEITGSCLLQGKAKSCGCYKIEVARRLKTTHGYLVYRKREVKPTEYSAWSSMKQRCYNKNNIGFKNWGAKGVTVCDRWLESFENFLEDMGHKPSPKHSLDRFPNRNGNYEPSNCRWGTQQQQTENRDVCKEFEYNGLSMILSKWADYLNADRSSIYRMVWRGKPFNEIVDFYEKKKKNAAINRQ